MKVPLLPTLIVLVNLVSSGYCTHGTTMTNKDTQLSTSQKDGSEYWPVDISTIVECVTLTVPIIKKNCTTPVVMPTFTTPVVTATPGPSSLVLTTSMAPLTTMVPTPTPTPTGPTLIFPDPACDCNICVLKVYDEENCNGLSKNVKWTSNDISILLHGSAAKSVSIDRGQCLWILYSKENYAGFIDIVEPSSFISNSFISSSYICKNVNNRITSVRRLPPLGSISLALFDDINYEGNWRLLCRSYCDLEVLDFNNKAKSAIALGGDWYLYDGKGFKSPFGHMWVPSKGLSYPKLSDFHSRSSCRVSSVGCPLGGCSI